MYIFNILLNISGEEVLQGSGGVGWGCIELILVGIYTLSLAKDLN